MEEKVDFLGFLIYLKTMLDSQIITEIKKILFDTLDERFDKAFIFGSRAMGTAGKYADIDIGIMSKEKIPANTISIIRENFEDSDIPYIVEVVDFHTLSSKFKTLAMKKTIPLN